MATRNAKWMEQQAARSPERGLQTLLIELMDEIDNTMKLQEVTRAEVARRAGLKREYVSRILNNPSNVTLATVVRIANAVSCELRLTLEPRTAHQYASSLLDGAHQDESEDDEESTRREAKQELAIAA